MIVYHGSNSCFRNLRIHESLVKCNSTLSNEGLGIYFCTDREVSESYGKYIYTIDIQDEYIKDFRDIKVCQEYIKGLLRHVYNQEKVNLLDYIDVKSLVNYMHLGGVAISNVGREIYMLIDSIEDWYISVSETKRSRVYKLLISYNKSSLHAFMFNYNIKNIGVIKDVSVATIIKREAR